MGRNTQIQQHAVHRRQPHLRQNRLHFVIIMVHHGGRIARQPFGCRCNCIRITVKANQLSAGSQALGNFTGVSGTAHGSVHINAVRPDCQSVQHLLQQNRNMLKFHGMPPRSNPSRQPTQNFRVVMRSIPCFFRGFPLKILHV